MLLSAPGKNADATLVTGVNDSSYDRHPRLHQRPVGLVVPEPAGELDGIAVRVPVEDGSLTDLAVVLKGERGVA